MAKVKNKRNSGLADKVNKKRKADINKKKLNPFEVHINREKIKVLGKKSKHDRGLPGISRAKAIQKRKETLGTEMKLMNKTNTFIDRRIGEKNSQLSAEDRMVARFAAEQARHHSKKNIYNLADDEVLTHRGQTLEQIEKFDDPRSDDEDDDGRFGGLGDEFVSEGHFGGGMLSKTDSKDGAKSHKDLIEQLIAESKKRKAEKQKEKEQTLDLTEKLDTDWKDLQPVVFKRPRVEEEQKESAIDRLMSKMEKKGEDYDKTMRELKFEKRGTPSDGLKSEEKQIKEEKQKIEKLEKEREQRMLEDDEMGTPKQQPTSKHRSADDLDDNFELEDEKEFMLAYDKDGKPLVPDHIFKANLVPNSKKNYEDGVSDTSSDDDDENDEGEDEESGNDDGTTGDKKAVDDNHDDANDESGDEDQGIDEMQEEKHDAIVNKFSQTNKENGNLQNAKNDSSDENSGDEIDNNDEESQTDGDEEMHSDDNDNFDDLKDLKESDEESSDDVENGDVGEKIGSFFDMKALEGENLMELLSGKSPSQQSVVLQRLIKKYNPSLAENNKELLSRLFAHMLQYVNNIFVNLNDEADAIKGFLIFDKIAPHFYDLAHTNKVSTKKFLIELLKEKHDIFQRNPKRVPDLDTLIFFKLVSLLYPTSDFRHPVTTPSLIFMSEILTLSRFKDAYSVSRGLFLTALILEYTTLSKRYVPAAINYLRGVLYLSANTSILNPVQVVPPFRLHGDIKFLNLEQDCSNLKCGIKMTAKDLVLKEADEGFKIRSLSTCVLMLRELFDNCNDMEAQQCIFEPHLLLLCRVDLDLYPKKVSKLVSETIQYMKSSLEVKTYTPLAREKKRPKALRLYEPDIQEVFTGSKSAKLSREKAESDKLKHKYRKEMKGALREIRRDKAYIASVKIRQKIQSDNTRKEKVKQIYKDAAIQQGELNQLKRLK